MTAASSVRLRKVFCSGSQLLSADSQINRSPTRAALMADAKKGPAGETRPAPESDLADYHFITLARPPGVDSVAASRYWAGTASSIVAGSSLFAVACLFWKSHSRLIPVV
jgi:hypothetical protein